MIAFLLRDLRSDLEAGLLRTPGSSEDGGRWLGRWVLISLLVGLTLFLFCGYHGGFARVNSLASRIPDPVWQWLTVLGDERVAFALSLFFTRRYPRVFWTLIAAAILGVAFTHSLKPLVAALRPPAVLEAGTINLIGPGHRRASFPSGHTVTAAIFFGVWTYYLGASRLRAMAVLLAIAAGLSRVAVGVHWPVDVAVGMAGGVAAALLGVPLARRVERYALDPSVHLALVTLAALMAVSLLLWDGGYGKAAQAQRLLAFAALGFAVFTYVIAPLRRWGVSRRGGA